jgi:hypothetical protein
MDRRARRARGRSRSATGIRCAALCFATTAGLACPASPQPGITLGPEMLCEVPVTGIARLTENAAARGLDLDYAFRSPSEGVDCFAVPGPVLATDLDADGDPDLVFHQRTGLPAVFLNDGGDFRRVGWESSLNPGEVILTIGAGDLDGDGLPELLLGQLGTVKAASNLGDGRFAAPSVVFSQPEYPKSCPSSLVLGDVDGDNDLDLLVTTTHRVAGPGIAVNSSSRDGAADLLLRNDGGSFSLGEPLIRRGVPGLSFLGAFTDRDGDGRMDVLVASDRPENGLPPTAFYANRGPGADGWPVFEDVMEELGVDPFLSGMGLVSADLNGDGRLDYCMSDIAPALRCWVSEGDGYVSRGEAMGLRGPPPEEFDDDWVPWSIVMADFDGDGIDDVAATAGGYEDQRNPDRLWHGLADGTYADRSAATGFDSADGHFGMALADFDGDGFPDLAVRPGRGPVQLWENPCGSGAWLQVELLGPRGNPEGFGARVELTVGDRVLLRELHGVRSLGQDDSVAFFGLGPDEVADGVKVVWPDGEVTEGAALGARRRVTVAHPERW